MKQLYRRLMQSDCGSTATEFALVAMTAISMSLGIIEFGRGLYLRNELSYAVDVAARKILTDPIVSDADLETLIRNSITFGASADLEVDFGTETINGTSFRKLLVSYPITLLIPNLSQRHFTLTVNHRVPLV